MKSKITIQCDKTFQQGKKKLKRKYKTYDIISSKHTENFIKKTSSCNEE